MKVIAKQENGHLLIEATPNEIANLLGVYSIYHMKKTGMSKRDIKPGLIINVTQSYERLMWLEQHAEKLANVRKTCQKFIDTIQPMPLVFDIANGEIKTKAESK